MDERYSTVAGVCGGAIGGVHDVRGISLGEFVVTAYTAGPESCGKQPGDPDYGITATGTRVTEHHTIAADWAVLPPGTVVEIEGLSGQYAVEDRGGGVRGRHVDLYIADLVEAREWGRQRRDVWILEEAK